MDNDMAFGDVQESAPRVHLRPDRNRHYAVAAYGNPEPNDLPVFLDLDALRDMEEHAASDTSVELGGVLLGGQYYDDDGQPFVVVTDSLRARHYQSTKGSFKFTHETWSQISRERDQFPPELQMVGWYHTHPDWGVFLSGMDMFICENFFNKPLDVALVIDPCRGDRGVFQWEDESARDTRRTGGFYLIASRFRDEELRDYVAHLEGGFAMTPESRSRIGGWNPAAGPVVHLNDARGGWLAGAAVALLSVQLLLLAVIVWMLLSSPPQENVAQLSQEMGELRQQLQQDEQLAEAKLRADAHAEVLAALVGQIEGNEGSLVEAFEEKEEENARLNALVRGQLALEKQLRQERDQLASERAVRQADYARREKRLNTEITALKKKNEDLRHKGEEYVERIALLNQELATYRPSEDGAKLADGSSRIWSWKWIGLMAGGALILLIGGAALVISWRKAEQEEEESLDIESTSDPPRR